MLSFVRADRARSSGKHRQLSKLREDANTLDQRKLQGEALVCARNFRDGAEIDELIEVGIDDSDHPPNLI